MQVCHLRTSLFFFLLYHEAYVNFIKGESALIKGGKKQRQKEKIRSEVHKQ